MVVLTTVSSAFEAKVVVARLGSDGIVCELRGAVDSMYPVGNVTVLVRATDLDTARALLMVDDVEDAFVGFANPPGGGGTDDPWFDTEGETTMSRSWTQRRLWKVAAVAALLALVVTAGRSLIGFVV